MKDSLEEAAERFAEKYRGEEQDPWYDFMEGAKWQQEQICDHNYILTSENGHRIIKCQKCNNTQPV